MFCRICLKSCERRYLKRENFEKILYANGSEKKKHKLNVVKNQVSWELIKNNYTNVSAHKQCKGTFFKKILIQTFGHISNAKKHSLKMIILISKSIPHLFKMIKVRNFIMKLQTHLKQPKFPLNVKGPERTIHSCHHGKTKIL